MRRTRAAGVVVAASLAVASSVALSSLPAAGTKPLPKLRTAYLTHDKGQDYAMRETAHQVVVSDRAHNTDPNIRFVWWDAAEKRTMDEQACTSFEAADKHYKPALLQEGIALRVKQTKNELYALTVTKNVYAGATYIFNVTTWTVPAKGTATYTRIDDADMAPALVTDGALGPEPWDLCARVIGSTLQFVVWLSTQPKPSWTDPIHSASFTLPVGWEYAGLAGWYAGHIHEGGSITYAAQSESALP